MPVQFLSMNGCTRYLTVQTCLTKKRCWLRAVQFSFSSAGSLPNSSLPGGEEGLWNSEGCLTEKETLGSDDTVDGSEIPNNHLGCC